MLADDEVELTSMLSPAEWWILLVSLFVFIANAAILAYIIKHRNYPPIRAKQVELVVISTIGGWCWVVGNFVSMFVLRGDMFIESCAFWTIVMQLIFGGFLWVVALIFRLYKLYKILVKPTMKVQIDGKKWMYMRMAMFYAPGFFVSVAALADNAGRKFTYKLSDGSGLADVCDLDITWSRSMVAMACVYFMVFVHFAIQLRHIRMGFNEFQGTKRAIGVMMALIGVGGLVLFANWDIYLWGRVVGSTTIIMAVNLFFIVSIVNPVWGCFWDRLGYAERFRAEMSMEATPSMSSTKGTKGKSKGSKGSKGSMTHTSGSEGSETKTSRMSSQQTSDFFTTQVDMDDVVKVTV